jgi:uncharacterized membrane protein
VEQLVTTPVNASAEQVWRLFIDVEHWSEITPTIREIRRLDNGPFQVGSEAVVRQPRLPKARWRVTAIDPGCSFTWENATAGVTVVAQHRVEPADENAAVITLTLRTEGPLGGPVGALTGGMTKKSITTEMEGFRRVAEQGDSGRIAKD